MDGPENMIKDIPYDWIKKANDKIKNKNDDNISKDQGFTRPKILILSPFKQFAFQVIEMITLLTNDGKWKKVSKRKKFRLDFGTEEEAFEDDFKIGLSIKHYKKTQTSELKLYEDFYKSDIIVASPLAMRLVTG